MDLYTLLNINPLASEEEILQAYSQFKARLSNYAPGIKLSEQDIHNCFPEVENAYRVLIDPEKRRTYDLQWSPPLPLSQITEEPEKSTSFQQKLGYFFNYAGFLLLTACMIFLLYILAGYSL